VIEGMPRRLAVVDRLLMKEMPKFYGEKQREAKNCLAQNDTTVYGNKVSNSSQCANEL
jgi:hypothetical protein